LPSSKPTVNPDARRGWPALFYALWICGAGFYGAAGCYSPPGILVTTVAPERCYARDAGFETRIDYLTPEELLESGTLLSLSPNRGGRPFTAARAPDVSALLISVLNYGQVSARVDLQGFRIVDAENGRVFAPITPAKYRAQYSGLAHHPLHYEFTFAQKEAHRFLQPLPDWFRPVGAGSTLSEAEYRQATRIRLERQAARHLRRIELAPGVETRGIVLFPLLPANRPYRLRYGDGSPDDAYRPPDCEFALTTRRTIEAPPGNENASRRRAERLAEFFRDRRELYHMHEQLRQHARLRE
jgi:hypothetical protein